jgi:protein-glucosylgalactosylhydroxylysine glucosidase
MLDLSFSVFSFNFSVCPEAKSKPLVSKSKITRRTFIGSLAAAGSTAAIGLGQKRPPEKIDRYAFVSRHNPTLRKLEPHSPLSVGNGEFAFTCDITGLQTFPDAYKDAMPLCTMSQWGWHTKPMPEHLKGKELKLNEYETYGRKVGYMTLKTGQEELFDYLRENPHRLHLGQIGLMMTKADGAEAKPADITDVEQRLDLWTGFIHSHFRFDGVPVKVRTAAHPTIDLLAVGVESPLVSDGRLSIRLAFPYGSQSMQAADWTQPHKHRSQRIKGAGNRGVILRTLDDDEYTVEIFWTEALSLSSREEHEFILQGRGLTALDFAVAFSPSPLTLVPAPDAAKTFAASSSHWKNFWTNGAAVDLSGSRDPRAKELERRVVLSQYVTAIQCSGSTPPQETGLTTNSWYGKYHLEMHWWHAAQFALWNRFPMLERSLDWYSKVLPSARERARSQGYKGARWAKMTDPTGRDSPSPVGTLLIWQQPHPIFYSELAYLNKPTKATLQKYQAIVQETAEWMADYAHFDQKTNRYVLGPPFIPAQENHPARETWNATYELEYWRYGLKTANWWRQKLGQARVAKWDDIVAKLSPLPVGDGGGRVSSPHVSKGSSNPTGALPHGRATDTTGIYLAHENCPQTYTERNHDHPSMLAALGVLRGEMVDRETMRRTLKKVMEVWDWPSTWGWDYPMIAMTAARLGEPAIAIDALMIDTPKNKYSLNGHNYQRPNLPLYLPGNGGLLYAIALMANGWKGAPAKKAPGFPSDGSWTVRSEGFTPAIFREI